MFAPAAGRLGIDIVPFLFHQPGITRTFTDIAEKGAQKQDAHKETNKLRAAETR